MTDDIFATNPIPQATQAQMAADELLRKVRSEMERRAGEHIDGWRAFWEHPAASPQDIADAMNGDAVRWLALARLNLQHVAAYAQLLGKSLDEFVPTKYQQSPQEVTTLTNGYITIGE